MIWLPQMRDAEGSEGAELDPVEVHALEYYTYRTFDVCIKSKNKNKQNNCFSNGKICSNFVTKMFNFVTTF